MKRDCSQAGHAIRLLAAISVGFGASTHAAIEQAPDGSTYIHVDDPRPVAMAASEISRHYGYGISYEDPAYLFRDDVRDITESVSKQTNASSHSKRILVPAGGTLDVRLGENLARDRDAVTSGMRAVLEAQTSTASGGRFEIEQSQGMLHVVPTAVRGENGEWIRQTSLLVQPINIPAGERSGVEMLRAIATAVSLATDHTVELGVMPLNAFRNVSQYPARSGPAREILIDLLKQSAPDLTWKLLYAPDLRRYYLSIVSFAGADGKNGTTPENATPPTSNPANQGLLGDPTAIPRKSR